MQHLFRLLVLGVLFVATLSQSYAAEPLQAGAATSNITPPLGTNVIGGFMPYPSKHVHDELHARCLVLRSGETTLAFVVCDLLGIQRTVSDEARRIIAERLQIPKDNVLISATHTHSAASAIGTDHLKQSETLDEYQAFVARRIADGVTRAANNLRPAELAFGTVDVPEHVFNRRWTMKPGTMPENPFGSFDIAKMNPPAGSPNLVAPAGPTDPTVSIIAVREPNGPMISVFATYSLHYVGGEGPAHISADYYGYFCRAMEKFYRDENPASPFVALLANGTSGDINNINFVTPRPAKPPYEQMQYVANDVAMKVKETVAGLKYSSDLSLAAGYREPEIAWRHPTDEQMAWAEKMLADTPADKPTISSIYAKRVMNLSKYPEKTNLPIQAFKIGEVCLATMPCETLCEIGLEFKQRSSIQPSFMVSLNHGYFGYLPPPRQHDLGGYETWIGTNYVERDTSVKLMKELLEMVEEMKK